MCPISIGLYDGLGLGFASTFFVGAAWAVAFGLGFGIYFAARMALAPSGLLGGLKAAEVTLGTITPPPVEQESVQEPAEEWDSHCRESIANNPDLLEGSRHGFSCTREIS